MGLGALEKILVISLSRILIGLALLAVVLRFFRNRAL